MVIWHAIVLGLLQGITEFFPVSSSGHLSVVPWMAGWDDFQGQDSLKTGFDVALHLGTLLGALVYFRADVKNYATAGIASLSKGNRLADSSRQLGHGISSTAKTAWLLLASAVPIFMVGAVLSSVRDSWNDEIWLISAMLIVFGLLLWLADAKSPSRELSEPYTTKVATGMGLAQILALIPGVSRSGVTITAARTLGIDRSQATRFAFLMGLPTIAGAGVYKFFDIGGWSGIPSDYRAAFIWGAITAAVSSWIAIWGLMKLVKTWTFGPFAIERILLALAAIILLASNIR